MFHILIPIVLIITVSNLLFKTKKVSLRGKHVAITEGCNSIGKAFGILVAKEGAHVTILGRNTEELIDAQEEIQHYVLNEDQVVSKIVIDVINYEDIENNLYEVEETIGPIFILMNCAEVTIWAKIEDYSVKQIKQLIDVNFLNTVYACKAMVTKFKERREGIFIITASQLSLVGTWGKSIYAACKFALRGLAESLAMEVKSFNISVTLALPPDPNNSRFGNETKLISQSARITKPEAIAKKILEDALSEHFLSYYGFKSWVLTTLCVGMTPFKSLSEIFIQSMVLGPLRLITAFYLTSFHDIK